MDQHLVQRIGEAVGSENVITSPRLVADRSRPLLVTDFPSMMGRKYSAEILVKPKSTAQISALLKLANSSRTPVYVVSGFTDTVGGSIPVKGGVLVDLSEFNKVLEVDKENLSVRVQPGVQLSHLEKELSKVGLRHGHHPASFPEASVGGPLAYFGAGIESPRYRTLAENVLGMEVVLPTGEILRIDYRGKSSMGETNLLWLFLGTEGQHGIITEATLRVYPYVAANRKVYLIAFQKFQQAASTSFEIARKGLSTTIMTIVDWTALVEYMPELSAIDGIEGVLIVAFDGNSPEEVDLDARKVLELVEKNSGLPVGEMDGEGYENTMMDYYLKYKEHRSDSGKSYDGYLFPALPKLESYLHMFREGTEICAKYGLEFFSMHLEADPWRVGIRFGTKKQDPGPDIEERIFTCRRELMQKVIALGGTVDAIHGAGLASGQYLERQMGSVGLGILKGMKAMLDPNNILNPGKRWETASV